MKILISTLIAGFSLSASACPTFNGTYACEGDGIQQTLKVKTSQVNGVSQYTIDETTVLADGQYRKVNYQGGLYDIAASCKAQTLNVNIMFEGGEGDNESCGAEKWNLRYGLSFTPNGENITEAHQATTVCQSGKEFPTDMKGSMNCVKM